MVAVMVVVFDEFSNGRPQLLRGVIVLQFDYVLHRTMETFNLALCHRVMGSTSNVLHVLGLEKILEVIR